MFVPMIIVGIGMISSGIYTLATKNVFGKDKLGKAVVETLNLSGKSVKIISMVIGVIMILIGLCFLLHGVLYDDPFKTFWLLK